MNIPRIIIALAFSLGGLYLRAQCLIHRNWSIDEVNQWGNTVGALKPFWQRFDYAELTCFPGDYLLTYPFIHAFGHNRWGDLAPHILATIIGFYFLFLICERYLLSLWGLAMAFLIYSLSNELIFHAFELRPYPLLNLLSLMVFYFTETIVYSKYSVSLSQKILIGLLFFVTLLYHAYGILIIGFCTLFAVINESSSTPLVKIFRRITTFYITVGLISLPLWWWYASYNIGQTVTHSPTFQFIPDPKVNPVGFFKNVFGNLIGCKFLDPLLLGPLFAILLPHASQLKYIKFFLILVVMPIALLFFMDVRMHYWFLQRQFIWVSALFGIFVAWGWEAVITFFKIRGLCKKT
jgi:hypothetical protein